MNLEGKTKGLGRSLQSLIELVVVDAKLARIGANTELVAIEVRIDNLEQLLWKALDAP